jgi:hypothetical protein
LLFVLFYVSFVCKCVLLQCDNPTAVNKYIIRLAKILTTALLSQEVLCAESARREHALYGNFLVIFALQFVLIFFITEKK